ncbi:N-acetylmuramoyl-L-alanine amidase-like domain-containing protein [Persicobacter sp. CCB-QB2]|uniref:N-acetylmuramoyl-L-alanine amidase-like domain-containing protein n=1 Tax=Persicobacter sp. CCB-QB2 TaxID=1561025 RepID=UPI0006A9A1DE|nr:N-acetylmuramoyl-L-alanine amidase-like domain-containing protein [Persicobacter sp. CCB-QB2]
MIEYSLFKIVHQHTKSCLSLILMLICSTPAFAQLTCSHKDHTTIVQILRTAETKNWRELPDGESLTEIGKAFIPTPYVANTLEQGMKEDSLIINVSGMDCTTFVEQVLAMGMTIKKNDPSFEKFGQSLECIRYRGGNKEGYFSRLHYFTDWIDDNENKSLIENISRTLSPEQLPKDLNFMSTHRSAYKALADNDSLWHMTQQLEKEINQRDHYFLPKDQIREQASQIKNGDIIALVTKIKGLDVSHVGFAYWQGTELHFLHASLKKGVMITEETLSDYLGKMKSNRGIIVARPVY